MKKKRLQYEENKTFENLFQPGYEDITEGFHLKGKWCKEYFRNNNPVILELGCGKGEYTIELSKRNPDKNFIGIDIKGARLWRGCKTAQVENLANVAFIRTRIELIEKFFGKEEVDEIWLTFPDPQKKKRWRIKRLTSPEFLMRYTSIMKPGGLIHLKTDSTFLFNYTLEVIRETGQEIVYQTNDLYASDHQGPVKEVQTFYEEGYLRDGKKINYLQFKLTSMEDISFFQKVYEVVARIPQGRVTSYGAIAKYLGSGGSARMVGWAMNQSHTSDSHIPAHRVVNRQGMLTGKHHFGGQDIMQQLLESEGIRVENDSIIDFEQHFWDPGTELS